jgi:ribonuclease HII
MKAARPATGFRCDGSMERELCARGFSAVAGVDEVGRGSLFGAVTAAAVILAPDSPIRGLDDSKKIEPERREILAERIRERALSWAVASVDSAMIDRINIYQASRLAMRTAVEQLQPPPDFLLIDAVPLELAIPQRPLIKGDERCQSIAAASILAKVHRDRTMVEWDKVYPEYGLASNKGYACPQHLRALAEHGAAPPHRLSFEPVRAHSRFPVERPAWMADQLELFAMEASCR